MTLSRQNVGRDFGGWSEGLLKDDLYKKMVSCNIIYELKEVHKVSYIHNYNKKSFCLDKYLQKKKKFWYRYSTKFFWYFFPDLILFFPIQI